MIGPGAIEAYKSNPVEHAGRRVITLAMMDEAHARPEGTAKRTFQKHRAQLREGEDYFRVAAGTMDAKRPSLGPAQGGGRDAVLLTESGYLLLVKAFRDPLAWQVQRDLVASYFRARSMVADPAMAMLVDQVNHVHAVLYNFVQGTLAAHDRRMDGLQHATEQRFIELERQVKQLRRGSRVSAMGRAGGRERKVKPQRARPLVSLPLVERAGVAALPSAAEKAPERT